VTAIALLVTAPLLPWSTFIADRDMIARNLAEQAGNLSAWGTPLLLLVIPALLFIGRAGGWLAVPAAWPATQLGYAAIALPAARIPLVALGLSIPVPLVPAVTVLALAGWTLAHRPPADGRPTLEPGLAAQEEAR
jgi:hypothetical protein